MSAQANKELITKFYTAFKNGDYGTMVACYHPEATFTDALFTLSGKGPGAMWAMLLSNSAGLALEFSGIDADETTGRAHWDATYNFSLTGRQVVNSIDAEFEFKDGLIYRQVDTFNFWKWSRMALGVPGVLLGWSSFMQNKVSAGANDNLTKFIEENPEYKN